MRRFTVSYLENVGFRFLSLRQPVLSSFERNLFLKFSGTFPDVTGIHDLERNPFSLTHIHRE